MVGFPAIWGDIGDGSWQLFTANIMTSSGSAYL
jgi:hypothetical protein